MGAQQASRPAKCRHILLGSDLVKQLSSGKLDCIVVTVESTAKRRPPALRPSRSLSVNCILCLTVQAVQVQRDRVSAD
jgi:hypothetical protein